MTFKTLVVSKYKVISKDEIIPHPGKQIEPSVSDFAKGKWFRGQYNRPGFGIYPIPRVKYVGKKNGIYEFVKEDGHSIKIPEKEMKDQRYAFFEDKDQSENLSGYTFPDYSDTSHFEKYQWIKERGIKTYILDCKKSSNMYAGSHIALTLKDETGKDVSHALMGFQKICTDLRDLGKKATEAAKHLWESGIKVKLGKNILSLLPLNV